MTKANFSLGAPLSKHTLLQVSSGDYSIAYCIESTVRTLSKDLRSYNLTHSEFIPAAKMRPSGSNVATGLPGKCIWP